MIFGIIQETIWANIDAILSVLSTFGILIAFGKIIIKTIIFYFKKYITFKKDFILICGLDQNSCSYIDSEINDNNNKIIVIEKDKNNILIETYQAKGILILIGDSTDKELLKSLSINRAKHILISTGQDLLNLELVTQILQLKYEKMLYVNIMDRHLRHFHKEQGIFKSSSIKMFSYYEEASRDLFTKFNIDGDDNSIINGQLHFSIAVIGNNHLAYEVISQACIMGQLPNENILTIYCIDKNIREFQQSIELNYTQIHNIKTVELKYCDLDLNSLSFYQDDIWHKNMTNVIICLDDEQKNLNIASNLVNITYIDKIASESLKTNIICAMFNDYQLTNNIKFNNKIFNNFYTFGGNNEINHKKTIINEERDIQAKSVNYIYNKIIPKLINYDQYCYEYTIVDINQMIDLEKEWRKIGYFKQESNRAVADHIKIKLKYLGLKIEKSDYNLQNLYQKNKNLFDKFVLPEQKLKLAKNEHQRWNTFYVLNGYKRIEIVKKSNKHKHQDYFELKKEHMCLMPFEEFKIRSNELVDNEYNLGEFEGYDFMIIEHIPLIMARSGYEIVLIKEGEN